MISQTMIFDEVALGLRLRGIEAVSYTHLATCMVVVLMMIRGILQLV